MVFIHKIRIQKNTEKCIKSAVEKLGFPIFVKPANAGSSVGISKAHNEDELKAGVETALKEDKKVILEEFIEDTRLSVLFWVMTSLLPQK